MRFRQTLGLTGLAALTMASGPCGACEPDTSQCYERTDLAELRTSALANADAAGMAGTAGTTHQAASDRTLAATWNGTDGCPTPAQIDAIWRLNGEREPYWGELEHESAQACCYKAYGECNGGRPFLVAGQARVAALSVVATPPLSDDARLRRALGESWTADALMEHASVASFARLTLRLLALGAPLELVEASQRAALDELEHARFCFERASQYLEQPLAPGPLALDGAFPTESFADFVRTNLIEGCIGETLAAARMNEQSRLAEDPTISRGLAVIAEDETRHAELAFRILLWCLKRDPIVTGRVLREVSAPLPKAPVSRGDLADPRWACAGRLAPSEAERLDQLTWQSTLAPLFREVSIIAGETRDTRDRERAASARA